MAPSAQGNYADMCAAGVDRNSPPGRWRPVFGAGGAFVAAAEFLQGSDGLA